MHLATSFILFTLQRNRARENVPTVVRHKKGTAGAAEMNDIKLFRDRSITSDQFASFVNSFAQINLKYFSLRVYVQKIVVVRSMSEKIWHY